MHHANDMKHKQSHLFEAGAAAGLCPHSSLRSANGSKNEAFERTLPERPEGLEAGRPTDIISHRHLCSVFMCCMHIYINHKYAPSSY